MPIRWNSAHVMLNIARQQEVPIIAVCATQQIDMSVREVIPIQDDWGILRQLLKFLENFTQATKRLQATTYPTLNYAILQYLQIIEKVKEVKQNLDIIFFTKTNYNHNP